jgi:hypothetical protein
MKLMICGSMTFAEKMLKTKRQLESLGHSVFVPPDIGFHIKDPSLIDNLEKNYMHTIEKDVLRDCFNLIAKSDAILVLNYPKNKINGYVGTSALMEIGLAYYLGKKIFLLNSIPKAKDFRWVHELNIIQPIVIEGDLGKIK